MYPLARYGQPLKEIMCHRKSACISALFRYANSARGRIAVRRSRLANAANGTIVAKNGPSRCDRLHAGQAGSIMVRPGAASPYRRSTRRAR